MDTQIEALQAQKEFRKTPKPKSYHELLKEKGMKISSDRGMYGGLRNYKKK